MGPGRSAPFGGPGRPRPNVEDVRLLGRSWGLGGRAVTPHGGRGAGSRAAPLTHVAICACYERWGVG